MALLEGLEVSEIKYNDLQKYSGSWRFDAEFFQKVYLSQDSRIAKNGSEKFSTVTKKINVGFVGAMVDYYSDAGVTLLQTKNIGSIFLQDGDTIKITLDFHDQLSKSKVSFEDILIARSGSFGKASIYLEKEVVNSSDIIIVQADSELINSYFLVAYLNSKFGTNQMIRFASGGLQGHVNLKILEDLDVPNLNKSFQAKIEKIIRTAYRAKTQSSNEYNKAEYLLLETLGMANFSPSSEPVNIKSFKESFGTSGRLDAEYYQPKYEQVITHIKSQNYQPLHKLVFIKKSIEPGSNAYCEQDELGLPFLRVADYSKNGLTPPQKHLHAAFVHENWDKLKDLMPRKNTILFSKDGSVGEAYCLTEDLEAITSGAVLHLHIKNPAELLPEYLTLVLNSQLIKMQSERDAGGSIILHWRVSEIEEVAVPLVDMEVQIQIAQLVQQSFALKAQSEHLLDVAKRAVEIAIEQDEAAAFAYIANEVKDGSE